METIWVVIYVTPVKIVFENHANLCTPQKRSSSFPHEGSTKLKVKSQEYCYCSLLTPK